jgi:xylose isomerase
VILKERAAAFRADPEVQQIMDAAKVGELSTPTLGDGETYNDLLERSGTDCSGRPLSAPRVEA